MSNPHLPAEILDHVVDVLHDTHDALRNCCLVSKSWIPRTRKHLFANVRFLLLKNVLSWTETFPNPANSPAHYTKNLCISLSVVTSKYVEVGDWIGGFSRVEHLAIMGGGDLVNGPVSLVPLHGFSPALKSLRVSLITLPSPQVFNLIISFPLVEDLAVISISTFADPYDSAHGYDEPPTATQPSSPYMFTGSLELYLSMGIVPFTRRLLSLPGGVHFRELTLRWLREEDHSLTTALVRGCSHTLESLDVACNHLGKSIRDLSAPITYFSSWGVEVSSDRPLASDKTQRCGVSTFIVEGGVDHHDAPNNHTQPSRPSTNLDSSASPKFRQHQWRRCLCRRQGGLRRSGLQRMVGP